MLKSELIEENARLQDLVHTKQQEVRDLVKDVKELEGYKDLFERNSAKIDAMHMAIDCAYNTIFSQAINPDGLDHLPDFEKQKVLSHSHGKTWKTDPASQFAEWIQKELFRLDTELRVEEDFKHRLYR